MFRKLMTYPKITGLLLCLITLPWQLTAEVGVNKKNVQLLPAESEDEQASKSMASSDMGDIISLSEIELEKLIGPIALYPDDLLAIVLPASTYPIDIVLASRFLDEYDADNSIEPSDTWDETVVALLNYPEVLRMMDEEIDWTARLGYAVINQQADLIVAIEAFRDRAYAAGNLETDEYQRVENNEGIIEITPVDEKVIYVPYYEPEKVIIYQTEPVYAYYPVPRPVYYYPYPVGYSFSNNRFWGVTTAFTIGWPNRYLHVHHRSYRGHPYYGHTYYGHYYRRPSISIYNTWYVQNHYHGSHHRHRDGDPWRSRNRHNRSPYHTTRVRNEFYSQDTRLNGHSENRGRDRRNSGQDQLSTSNEPGRTRTPFNTPRTTANGSVNLPRVDGDTQGPITTRDRLADHGRSRQTQIRGRDRLNTRQDQPSTPIEPGRAQNPSNTTRSTVYAAVNQPSVNGNNRNLTAVTDRLADPARSRQIRGRDRLDTRQDQRTATSEPGRTRIPPATARTPASGSANQSRVEGHNRNLITAPERMAEQARSRQTQNRRRDRHNTRQDLRSTSGEASHSSILSDATRTPANGSANQASVNGHNRNLITTPDRLADQARSRQRQTRRHTASDDHAAIQFRERSTNRVTSSERAQVSRVAQAGSNRQVRDATRPARPSSYQSTTTAQTTRVQPHRTAQTTTTRSSSPDRSIRQTRSQQTSTRSITEPSASVRRTSSRSAQRQQIRPPAPQRQPSNPGASNRQSSPPLSRANEPRSQRQRAPRQSTSTATTRSSSGRNNQQNTATAHSKPKGGRSRASNVH